MPTSDDPNAAMTPSGTATIRQWVGVPISRCETVRRRHKTWVTKKCVAVTAQTNSQRGSATQEGGVRVHSIPRDIDGKTKHCPYKDKMIFTKHVYTMRYYFIGSMCIDDDSLILL